MEDQVSRSRDDMDWWPTLDYQYVEEDTTRRVEVERALDHTGPGERIEQDPRGEERSHCVQDHAQWNLAYIGVEVYPPMDPS